MIPARSPHAWVDIDLKRYPALVLGWEKIRDTNGYHTWWAEVAYWDGVEVRREKVPRDRVEPAGGMRRR